MHKYSYSRRTRRYGKYHLLQQKAQTQYQSKLKNGGMINMPNFGFLSLVPVILAVTIAIKYKNVVLALFVSVLTGVLILVNFSPVTALTEMIGTYFFAQLQDSYNAGVLVLMVFIGGFIALMEKSGGALAFAAKASQVIKTRAKVQLAAWIGGIIIFFSDLGTPLIVGPIFEPLFDKLKVSKEKLAYIIDTTAAPAHLIRVL